MVSKNLSACSEIWSQLSQNWRNRMGWIFLGNIRIQLNWLIYCGAAVAEPQWTSQFIWIHLLGLVSCGAAIDERLRHHKMPHQLPHQSEFCRNMSAFIPSPLNKCKPSSYIYLHRLECLKTCTRVYFKWFWLFLNILTCGNKWKRFVFTYLNLI